MTKIEVFSLNNCPYCVRAKALLNARQLPFEEIDIGKNAHRTEEMTSRSGRRTVPQVFIDGRFVGGFAELAALHAAGGL